MSTNLTKEAVVTELYGLRAGLSVVSQHYDKVKQLEAANEILKEEIEYKEKCIADDERKCEEMSVQIEDDIKYTNPSAWTATNERIDKYNKEVKSYTSVVRSNRFLYILRNVLTDIYILMIAYCVYICITAETMDVSSSNIGMIYFLCSYGTLFFIGLSIYSIVRIVKRRNKLKDAVKELNLNIKWRDEQVELLAHDVERSKKSVIEDKKSLNELKDNIANDKNGHKKKIEEHTNSINENLNDITIYSNQSKLLKEALEEKYNYLLTQADWFNTDLIIFYLQTGRADTLKEALQQADRQRQTDSIVNELRHAASSVSATITSGFGTLATAIGRCFGQLSYQLNNYTQQIGSYTQQAIENMHNDINNSYAQIISSNKELISEQKLQTALLAKANESSDDLMNELRYQQKYWVK